MVDAELRANELRTYMSIMQELNNSGSSVDFDERQYAELIDELEFIRDCTDWLQLRKQVINDLARLVVKADVTAGVEIRL